jgi:hypothetical protein
VEYKIKSKGTLYSVLVDDEDVSLFAEYKFMNVIKTKRTGHLHVDLIKVIGGNNKNRKHMLMHRLIMNAPSHLQVDHINGNSLDNRKCNLRLVTNKQNSSAFIRLRKGKASKYRGVGWDKATHKWRASITHNYKMSYLGEYELEEKAALAYNKAALELFGEFAQLNILTPAQCPDTI